MSKKHTTDIAPRITLLGRTKTEVYTALMFLGQDIAPGTGIVVQDDAKAQGLAEGSTFLNITFKLVNGQIIDFPYVHRKDEAYEAVRLAVAFQLGLTFHPYGPAMKYLVGILVNAARNGGSSPLNPAVVITKYVLEHHPEWMANSGG